MDGCGEKGRSDEWGWNDRQSGGRGGVTGERMRAKWEMARWGSRDAAFGRAKLTEGTLGNKVHSNNYRTLQRHTLQQVCVVT